MNCLRVAKQRAVEVDVLARGELDVKAGAELDERRDVAAHDARRPQLGSSTPAMHLEHGRLARAVRAHKADDLAAAHLEANVLEGAELLEEQLVP